MLGHKGTMSFAVRSQQSEAQITGCVGRQMRNIHRARMCMDVARSLWLRTGVGYSLCWGQDRF